MLSLEGCEVFQDGIEKVAFWRERGIRMGAPVWNNENALATPAKKNPDDGLTDYGVKVIREMQDRGMAVDVSHLNEQGFYDLFMKGHRPPMASHSCCRALCDHFRNLTDEQIRAVIQSDGIIGLNLYPPFVNGKTDGTLRDLLPHIEHICSLGGAKNLAIGSDLDGIDCFLSGGTDSRFFLEMHAILEKSGFPSQTVRDILGENFMNKFCNF
jgi:membrane dipeptidase